VVLVDAIIRRVFALKGSDSVHMRLPHTTPRLAGRLPYAKYSDDPVTSRAPLTLARFLRATRPSCQGLPVQVWATNNDGPILCLPAECVAVAAWHGLALRRYVCGTAPLVSQS